MPTEYSKCHECHYVDVFPITHKINIFYFRDYQKVLALTESTMIPIEIAAKIVSMSKEYIIVIIVFAHYFVKHTIIRLMKLW